MVVSSQLFLDSCGFPHCAIALSMKVLSRRYVYEEVWKFSAGGSDVQTLRQQFMAKILAAEAHIFMIQFAGLSGADYDERIRDGDPKKEYTGQPWSTYFQARAGALLMNKELIEFLLDLETKDMPIAIPHCRLEADFLFHSRIDTGFYSILLEIAPEDAEKALRATRLIETIKHPDHKIYENHWRWYQEFVNDENEKAEVFLTNRRSPRHIGRKSTSSHTCSSKIRETVPGSLKEEASVTGETQLSGRGGRLARGKGRLNARSSPANPRSSRFSRTSVTSALGRPIRLFS